MRLLGKKLPGISVSKAQQQHQAQNDGETQPILDRVMSSTRDDFSLYGKWSVSAIGTSTNNMSGSVAAASAITMDAQTIESSDCDSYAGLLTSQSSCMSKSRNSASLGAYETSSVVTPDDYDEEEDDFHFPPYSTAKPQIPSKTTTTSSTCSSSASSRKSAHASSVNAKQHRQKDSQERKKHKRIRSANVPQQSSLEEEENDENDDNFSNAFRLSDSLGTSLTSSPTKTAKNKRHQSHQQQQQSDNRRSGSSAPANNNNKILSSVKNPLHWKLVPPRLVKNKAAAQPAAGANPQTIVDSDDSSTRCLGEVESESEDEEKEEKERPSPPSARPPLASSQGFRRRKQPHQQPPPTQEIESVTNDDDGNISDAHPQRILSTSTLSANSRRTIGTNKTDDEDKSINILLDIDEDSSFFNRGSARNVVKFDDSSTIGDDGSSQSASTVNTEMLVGRIQLNDDRLMENSSPGTLRLTSAGLKRHERKEIKKEIREISSSVDALSSSLILADFVQDVAAAADKDEDDEERRKINAGPPPPPLPLLDNYDDDAEDGEFYDMAKYQEWKRKRDIQRLVAEMVQADEEEQKRKEQAKADRAKLLADDLTEVTAVLPSESDNKEPHLQFKVSMKEAIEEGDEKEGGDMEEEEDEEEETYRSGEFGDDVESPQSTKVKSIAKTVQRQFQMFLPKRSNNNNGNVGGVEDGNKDHLPAKNKNRAVSSLSLTPFAAMDDDAAEALKQAGLNNARRTSELIEEHLEQERQKECHSRLERRRKENEEKARIEQKKQIWLNQQRALEKQRAEEKKNQAAEAKVSEEEEDGAGHADREDRSRVSRTSRHSTEVGSRSSGETRRASGAEPSEENNDWRREKMKRWIMGNSTLTFGSSVFSEEDNGVEVVAMAEDIPKTISQQQPSPPRFPVDAALGEGAIVPPSSLQTIQSQRSFSSTSVPLSLKTGNDDTTAHRDNRAALAHLQTHRRDISRESAGVASYRSEMPNICVVCNEEVRSYLAVPCMHFAFCEYCVDELQQREGVKKCPVCNEPNVTFSKVLF